MTPRVVYLCPGQGSDIQGALRVPYGSTARVRDLVDPIVDDIASGAPTLAPGALRTVLLTAEPDATSDPDLLRQVGVYALSVVLGALLTDAGMAPQAVIGQSFGEIAALVCAGALDPRDGAVAVTALHAAFAAHHGLGATASIAESEHRTRALLADFGSDELVVACVNSPRNTLVSGPTDVVDRFLATAAAAPAVVRLPIPYAAHHPSLGPVADHFRRGLRAVPLRTPRIPVYSPVRRRAYRVDDDLRRALADCVTEPVLLTETLTAVAAEKSTMFVELGVGTTLSACVRATVPDAHTLSPLADRLLGDAEIPRLER